MTEEQAQEELQGVQLVPAAKADMQSIKRMRNRCLQADIPALFSREGCSGKS